MSKNSLERAKREGKGKGKDDSFSKKEGRKRELGQVRRPPPPFSHFFPSPPACHVKSSEQQYFYLPALMRPQGTHSRGSKRTGTWTTSIVALSLTPHCCMPDLRRCMG